MSIGDNIKKVRKKRKVTQEQLAEDIGLSRSYIGDLENNRYNPSTKTLDMLAQRLDVSALYLSTGNDSFIDLSYGDSIGEFIVKTERKQKTYKENAKHADDFDFKEIDEVVERLANAVYYQKNIIRNDEKMSFHDAAFLKDLYLYISESNPANFNLDDQKKIREIILLLLSDARDIDINEIHKMVEDNKAKRRNG